MSSLQPIDPASPVRVAVGGSRYWNGFTAELTITNTSGADLSRWSFSFDSPHAITGSPWGATVSATPLAGGLTRYTLTGDGWAASLKAGASIKVGFNGSQGVAIGNSGALTRDLLFAPSSAPPPVTPPSVTPPPVTPPPTTPPPPPPPATPTPPPPAGAAPVSVAVGGSRYWNGFTAELTITNTSGADLSRWSFSFDSPHAITGSPWGATVSATPLAGGLTRYTLTGEGWAASLKAGASIKVGFNGSQGVAIGNSGALTRDLLFAPSSAPPPVTPPSVTPPPVTQPPPPASTTPKPAYAEVLAGSFLFYEANRSGNLDEATNRVSWRGDSGLRDGADGLYFGDRRPENLQAGMVLDLTGGYHDAGDHGKFGLPLASTLSTLAWGGLSFRESYTATGQLDALLATVKWGTDYLLKAHGREASGATRYLVAQVGDVAADHALWSAPETQTIPRPALAITPEKPGSDLAAATAAALASASVLFRENGAAAYADELLDNARALYTFADRFRGKYSDAIPSVQNYYNSWSGFQDELAYGAAWLARATDAAGGDGNAYRSTALQTYRSAIGGLNRGWTHNWDDASYATAVLLATDTGDAAIRRDVERWLDSWVAGTNGVTISPGGLRSISPWGSLRYAANTALMAGIYTDAITNPKGAYTQLALDTVDYILGANPRQSSYVVGYGDAYPLQPHHRAASGVGWDGFRNNQPNAHVLVGALVGGPRSADDFDYSDRRDDYISNEVAIDYNAGWTGALAFAIQATAPFSNAAAGL